MVLFIRFVFLLREKGTHIFLFERIEKGKKRDCFKLKKDERERKKRMRREDEMKGKRKGRMGLNDKQGLVKLKRRKIWIRKRESCNS